MSNFNIDEYRRALNHEPRVYQWLRDRGLYHSAVEKFRLGYDGSRLSIPYFDYFGRVVDVARRSLNGGDPKYLRSGNFPFMVRSADADRVILCEGELDTITAHMAGYKALGIPGSECWEDEWAYLLRDCDVTIAFDGDDAGHKLTARVAKVLRLVGVDARVVDMPEGKDINDLWVQGGKRALSRMFGKAGTHAS